MDFIIDDLILRAVTISMANAEKVQKSGDKVVQTSDSEAVRKAELKAKKLASKPGKIVEGVRKSSDQIDKENCGPVKSKESMRNFKMPASIRREVLRETLMDNLQIPPEKPAKQSKTYGVLFKAPVIIRRDVIKQALDEQGNKFSLKFASNRRKVVQYEFKPKEPETLAEILSAAKQMAKQKNSSKKASEAKQGSGQAKRTKSRRKKDVPDTLAGECKTYPHFFVCQMCPDVSVNLSENQVQKLIDEFEVRAKRHEESMREISSADNLSSILDTMKKRAMCCSSMPHPNVFFDAKFAGKGYEKRFPVFDTRSVPTLGQVRTAIEHAVPTSDECYCAPGREVRMCHFCKYFFYTLSVMLHTFSLSFSADCNDMLLFCLKIEEVTGENRKTGAAKNEQSRRECPSCHLPVTFDEFEELTKEGRKQDCDTTVYRQEMRNIIGGFLLSYEMLDMTLHSILSLSLTSWRNPFKIAQRQTFGASKDFDLVTDCFVQLGRLSCPFNSVASAYRTFYSLLNVRPSFAPEKGTFMPTDSVISVHRLNTMLKMLSINVIPALSTEYKFEQRNSNVSSLKSRNLGMRIRKMKAVCKSISMGSSRMVDLVEQIQDMVEYYQPREIMANIHRFDNSNQLVTYKDSFSNRKLLFYTLRNISDAVANVSEAIQMTMGYASTTSGSVYDCVSELADSVASMCNDLTVVAKDVFNVVRACNNGKSSRGHSAMAACLFELLEHCTFCGRFPVKKAKREADTCPDCDVAFFCSKSCYDRHRPVHAAVCYPALSDIISTISGWKRSQVDALVSASRKIQRGEPVTKRVI